MLTRPLPPLASNRIAEPAVRAGPGRRNRSRPMSRLRRAAPRSSGRANRSRPTNRARGPRRQPGASPQSAVLADETGAGRRRTRRDGSRGPWSRPRQPAPVACGGRGGRQTGEPGPTPAAVLGIGNDRARGPRAGGAQGSGRRPIVLGVLVAAYAAPASSPSGRNLYEGYGSVLGDSFWPTSAPGRPPWPWSSASCCSGAGPVSAPSGSSARRLLRAPQLRRPGRLPEREDTSLDTTAMVMRTMRRRADGRRRRHRVAPGRGPRTPHQPRDGRGPRRRGHRRPHRDPRLRRSRGPQGPQAG